MPKQNKTFKVVAYVKIVKFQVYLLSFMMCLLVGLLQSLAYKYIPFFPCRIVSVKQRAPLKTHAIEYMLKYFGGLM